MRFLALISFVFALVPPVVSARQPNVIFVLADDLGYGDLGCYGQKTLLTPNLDGMASQGMRFTRHYAGSTVCAPSRCVLLTGKHIGHASVRGNQHGLILDEEVTIAEMLRDAGYTTGCVGKWGVGNPPPINDPKRNGFDHFFGYVNMYHAHNFYPEFIVRQGKRVALQNVLADKWKTDQPPGREGRGVAKTKIDYVPNLVAKEALQFIASNQNKPFFLYYALNVPHANNEGTREPGVAGMEVPTLGKFSNQDWPEPEKGFASMMKNIDDDMGRLFSKLKELQIDEQTIVFFSSDNGPHEEGGHKMPFFDSNGKFQGKKRDLYEGGIRVPLIVRWPNKIQQATVSNHICGFQDLMPTLSDLCQANAPKLDGISFAPTLLKSGKQPKHDHLYWEFSEQGGKQAVLKDGWKAIRLNWNQNPNGPISLYKVSGDTPESEDVAEQNQELVAEMREIMATEHQDN